MSSLQWCLVIAAITTVVTLILWVSIALFGQELDWAGNKKIKGGAFWNLTSWLSLGTAICAIALWVVTFVWWFGTLIT